MAQIDQSFRVGTGPEFAKRTSQTGEVEQRHPRQVAAERALRMRMMRQREAHLARAVKLIREGVQRRTISVR